MSEALQYFFWLEESLAVSGCLILALLCLSESWRLRKRFLANEIFLFLFWFTSTLLLLVFLRWFSHTLIYFLKESTASKLWPSLFTFTTSLTHLAFVVTAAAALTYEYMMKQFRIREKQSQYIQKLEQVNDLVLQMVSQATEDVENLPRFSNPNLVRCWEATRCQRTDCVLYGQVASRCWQVKHEKQCHLDCQCCYIYQKAVDDSCDLVGEIFNNMFSLLDKNLADIRAQNQNYQEMLGFISHELKTPLVPLTGYVSLLLQGTLGELNEGQRDALLIIQRNLEDLKELIARYLELARLEKGTRPPVYSLVNFLPQVLEPALAALQPRLAHKGMRLELLNLAAADIYLEADAELLGVVLDNLLDNAVKYGREKSKVTVRILAMGGTALEVRIGNAGGGIPPAMEERIFEKFVRYQNPRESSPTRGAGLGLYIARQIVQLHQGSIRIEHLVDVYTEFIVRLPLRRKRNATECAFN